MPFVNNFDPVNFINQSVQPTGTPDVDAAWLNYVQGIIDAQGDGLASYSSDLEALEGTVSGFGSAFLNPGFIAGLEVEYISATSIRIKSGACYTPAVGDVASKLTDTTYNPTSPALAANTWYYVYATDVGGSLVFTHSTTQPVTYFGRAKQMSGDATKRYVGEFRTYTGSANIISFRVQGQKVVWRMAQDGFFAAPFNGVSNKQNTTVTTANADATPALSQIAQISVLNESNQPCVLADPAFLSASVYEQWVAGGNVTSTFDLALNDSRQYGVRLVTATGNGLGAYAGVTGYTRER